MRRFPPVLLSHEFTENVEIEGRRGAVRSKVVVVEIVLHNTRGLEFSIFFHLLLYAAPF